MPLLIASSSSGVGLMCPGLSDGMAVASSQAYKRFYHIRSVSPHLYIILCIEAGGDLVTRAPYPNATCPRTLFRTPEFTAGCSMH